MPVARLFEYTSDQLVARFRLEDGTPLIDELIKLPCLFMREGVNQEAAHVGTIVRARIVGRDIAFEYFLSAEVPPLINERIFANKADFDMPHDFEFSRNHWAIKDVDLYRELFRLVRPRRQLPTVFTIAEHERIEEQLVSVMMPYSARLAPVFQTVQDAASAAGLRCRRADNIWEAPAVIQDVVSLIDRSRVVVCDCTGRNANVFYETGIAHTLGREVILITQSEADIPFDLRHLRFIEYTNNVSGRTALAQALLRRLSAILER